MKASKGPYGAEVSLFYSNHSVQQFNLTSCPVQLVVNLNPKCTCERGLCQVSVLNYHQRVLFFYKCPQEPDETLWAEVEKCACCCCFCPPTNKWTSFKIVIPKLLQFYFIFVFRSEVANFLKLRSTWLDALGYAFQVFKTKNNINGT